MQEFEPVIGTDGTLRVRGEDWGRINEIVYWARLLKDSGKKIVNCPELPSHC